MFYQRRTGFQNQNNCGLNNRQTVQSHITTFNPSSDIFEFEGLYEIHVLAPGLNKDKFSIEIIKDRLVVKGEREFYTQDNMPKSYRVESEFGKFERIFLLPENVDTQEVNAEYQNGILILKLNKVQPETYTKVVSVK